MRRWNSWDDDTIDYSSARRATEALAALRGPGTPRDMTLPAVLATVPPSRFPPHPLIVTDAEACLDHTRGQSFKTITIRGQVYRSRSGRAECSSMSESAARFDQLRLALRHVTLLVWRRVLVRNDTSIAQRHRGIQATMGWDDSQLHRFRIHGKDYGSGSVGSTCATGPHPVTLASLCRRSVSASPTTTISSPAGSMTSASSTFFRPTRRRSTCAHRRQARLAAGGLRRPR